MRPREELEGTKSRKDFIKSDFMLEVLLDIRDELVKLNDKDFINNYGALKIVKEDKE